MNRRQAISWTNDDPVCGRIDESLSMDELTRCGQNQNADTLLFWTFMKINP